MILLRNWIFEIMKISELFSQPAAWTTGTMARNAEGMAVGSTHSEAVCWCLMGAVMKCYRIEERGRVFDKIRKRVEPSSISQYNDVQGYENVVNLVKELGI